MLHDVLVGEAQNTPNQPLPSLFLAQTKAAYTQRPTSKMFFGDGPQSSCVFINPRTTSRTAVIINCKADSSLAKACEPP